MPAQENGACIYLTEDNKCSVYDQRPMLCNVEKMYHVRKSVCDGKFPLIKFNMTKKDYFKTNSLCCNELMQLEGLSEDFRIDISKYDKMQE
jgi:Fe-S-cluster containining protein